MMNTKNISSPIWMARCRQLESTAASGITSRGTATRLIRFALSNSEVVPEDQASAKKLYGTKPQSTNSPKSGMLLLGKIFVNTKVSTAINTSRFSSDQKTPSDMLP